MTENIPANTLNVGDTIHLETGKPLTINGVPASITRAKYLALIETLGLDPHSLIELNFGMNAITATVFARDKNGQPYQDPHEHNTLAKHHISIPIVDA